MKRYWEIDVFRGFAILCMVVFHSFFIVVFFGIVSIDLWSGFFWWFPRVIAAAFLFTAGLSLTISYSKSNNKSFKKFLIRGLKIFGLGMILTAITFTGLLVLQNITGYVQITKVIYFGILHCIGISLIAGYFFLNRRILSFITGIAVMIVGFSINDMRFDFPWLFWLGFWPDGYYPIDYEPLLPWMGPVLLGIAFGNTVYKNGMRPAFIRELNRDLISGLLRGAAFLGRHSLIIYLCHVPVLAGIIFCINWLIS